MARSRSPSAAPRPAPMPAGDRRAARALAGLPPTTTGLLLTMSWALLPLADGWLETALMARWGAPWWLGLAPAALAPLVPAAMAAAAHAPRWTPRLLRLALAAAVGVAAAGALDHPLAFLAVVGGGGLLLAALGDWFAVPPGLTDTGRRPPVAATDGALVGALAVWVAVRALEVSGATSGRAALAGALLVGAGWCALRAGGRGAETPRARLAAAALTAPLPMLPMADAMLLALPGLVALALCAAALRHVEAEPRPGSLGLPAPEPAVVVAASFAGAGVIGGVLLALPAASAGPAPLPFLDALFTAFSAVCVTGLIVVDTPVALSGFGESVVLVLIQLGGLGIMTFSTGAILLLGRKLSLRYETTAAELVDAADRGGLAERIRLIIGVTVLCELLGALALTAAFAAGGEPLGPALWRGVFTAVSAFCNAGFALQTDSLVPYAADPTVLLVTAALIVLGGLGPLVIATLAGARRGVGRVAMRLIVRVTLALLAVGWLGWLAFEWDRTLADLGAFDRVVNAFFQSVTLRTAGFNSVDLAAVHPATYSMMLALMFVGGCPGSTAGGIKVTTLAVLALLVRAAFRDHEHVEAFGFEVAPAAIRKATAVSFLGVVVVAGLLLALLATQAMSLDVALFEAVSAFGTVGLSIGGTAQLDAVGEVIVIGAMYAGRVGPLTLLLVLARRARTPPRRGATEDVPVG